MRTNGNTLTYLYDENGTMYGFELNGVRYYYLYNGQGDVIGLIDATGAVIAHYEYDAWGKLLSVTDANGEEILYGTEVAIINPIRYRGYYYDNETGFYYLNSRYYDPEVGRFINADAYASTGQGVLGHNMFAYCQNNPIKYYDIDGYCIGVAIGTAIGGIGGLIGGGISAAINGENILNGMASGALGGMVGGAVAGTIVEVFVSPATSLGSAAIIGALAGGVGGAVGNAVTQSSGYYFNNGSFDGFELDVEEMLIAAFTGTIFNSVGTYVGQSQLLAYNGEKLVSAIASGYFTIGNAIADDIYAVYDAIQSQILDAYLGKRENPYDFTITDVIAVRKKQLDLFGY